MTPFLRARRLLTRLAAGTLTVAAAWVARWSSTPGTLPAGAPYHTFWQYTASGSVAGVSGAVDRNSFNGDRSRLIALANNT
jgi:GH25 family lysozyme M1 (1,4-beta-N-acetylmuramidase)